ncbi:hypothetical protein IC235_17410 [Hymenobacter sp. BT664]|uniref:Uncharacterized protein n=1 Tax=Hymenobacter montanus TaxID=2771359 RepID=A0A927BF10_9BACT|nr:hypothetical protein [Hymenobacter montanus]MBD2769671.1 hypothetical protein [Hymenobacter montanus]
MVAIAFPIAQVTNLTTASLTAQAAALGYPAVLFGLTPAQGGYWREPGLPWLTAEMHDNMPLGYGGYEMIRQYCEFGGNDMAPRFPKGCWVNMAPVHEKKNLVVGKVYVYCYLNHETGKHEYQAGRLESIGGNCLWARADNNPAVGLCWLLNEDEPHKAVWDVYEITHYVSYPSEEEQQEGASRA